MSFNHQIWNINFSGIHGWGEHQILKVDSGANKEPPNRCHVWTTYSGACIVAAKLERRQDVAILEHCCCQVGATEEPRGCIVWALFLPRWRNSGAKRLQSWITVAAMLELGEKLHCWSSVACCQVGAKVQAAWWQTEMEEPSYSECWDKLQHCVSQVGAKFLVDVTWSQNSNQWRVNNK